MKMQTSAQAWEHFYISQHVALQEEHRIRQFMMQQ